MGNTWVRLMLNRGISRFFFSKCYMNICYKSLDFSVVIPVYGGDD